MSQKTNAVAVRTIGIDTGFEIETEIIVHALELRMSMTDVDTDYGCRPKGSLSKLSTFSDGARILRLIGFLIKEERPLSFFGVIGLVLFILAVVIFIPVFREYIDTGLVRRFPTAILATGLVLASAISVACGLVLSTVTLDRREIKRLLYLQQPDPGIPSNAASNKLERSMDEKPVLEVETQRFAEVPIEHRVD
jgi:hypothetical protein